MRYPVEYIIHNPIESSEAIVTDFDPAKLKKAFDAGMVFIVTYNTGEREVVHWSDVKEPEPIVHKIPIVSHEAFMSVIGPMLEAIAELQAAKPKAISANGEPTAYEQAALAYKDLTEQFKKDFPDGYGD